MSETTTVTAPPFQVEGHGNGQEGTAYGKLRYVADGHTPEPSPHNFHLPAIAEFSDIRRVHLHSMRPVPTIDQLQAYTEHPQLPTHGFTAIDHATTLHSAPHTISSWKDPSLLAAHYIPETESMLKRLIGCRTVITETLLLRSNLWSESDALAQHAVQGEATPTKTAEDEAAQERKLSELETGFPQFIGFNPAHGGASPAPKIHIDFAPSGARLHVRNYHPTMTAAARDIVAAEDKLVAEGKDLAAHYKNSEGPRWALYSIWRPLKVVKRDPLALGDPSTFAEGDFVSCNIRMPYLGREGVEDAHDSESYVARYSDGQKWYWIEEQRPEEVLVIGLWDSSFEEPGKLGFGGTFHSSVDLDGAETEQEPRESLELRCLAIW
ncbi:uncharacterized protein HMPREF1541_09794 [Cyphellophora europaea CBS 101466]|uniref:GA4 desaturase n=1 Tax=Cyphellophora europaea (strain CBS 101466) TaxID=1220924 RepID=W2SAK2_CYPE1|nr:uncharacterized protein HMPREF1541_09794 [Cyphellophora europaea CBS 101466]ETN44919.1 hypothetical protein HMPREF1541_09794 [Cyphellophora europaea CBS 101466]